MSRCSTSKRVLAHWHGLSHDTLKINVWPLHRTFEFSDIRVRWNLDRDLLKYTPRFNIAPETSPNIPVIIRQQGVNECRLMQWGLVPSWAKDPSIGNQMINVRAESLLEKLTFEDLVRS